MGVDKADPFKPSIDRYMYKTGIEGNLTGGGAERLVTRADKGAFVTELTLYTNPAPGPFRRYLQALEVKFSNGDVETVGQRREYGRPGFSDVFHFGPFSNNVMFKSGEIGTFTLKDSDFVRAGLLKLVTSTGTTFSVGDSDYITRRHSFECGSGLLLGFNVRAGVDIDALGLVFLRPYTTYKDDFKLDSLIVDAQVLDEVHYSLAAGSSGKYTYTYTATKSATVETGKSVTDTVGESMRIGTSVTAEIGTPETSPIALSLSATVSYDAEASISSSINNTRTDSLTYEESRTTATEINMPESDKDATWTVAVIKFTTRASGMCERTVTTVDGAKWTWKFPFKYTGSDASNVVVKKQGQHDWSAALKHHPT